MSKREPKRKGAHLWRKARKEQIVVPVDRGTAIRLGRRSGKVRTVDDVLRQTLACGPAWTCSRCGAWVRSRGRPGHFRQPRCEAFLLTKIMDS